MSKKRTVALVATLATVMVGVTLLQTADSDPEAGSKITKLVNTGCVYPTGTINHTSQTKWQECRFNELLNNTSTPTPTATATPSPTATTAPPTAPPTTPVPTTAPTTTSPTPTPTPTEPPTSTFPDASNTGPSGTLTTTSGNPWINQPGTVIENRRHTGTLQVAAPNVIIRNVHLIGNITVDEAAGGSVLVVDTLVNNGTNFNSGAISGNNMTIRRTEIIGGGHSMSCKWNCTIEDNWFHAQANPGSGLDVHGDGILFNVANNMIVRHNTLACDMPADGGGACSAGLAMYGDWGPVQNVVVDNNLFKASPAGYCMYGGAVIGKPYGAFNVDVTNNVFERGANSKCAVYGPYSARAFDSASSWIGNKWSDGTALN